MVCPPPCPAHLLSVGRWPLVHPTHHHSGVLRFFDTFAEPTPTPSEHQRWRYWSSVALVRPLLALPSSLLPFLLYLLF